MVAVRHHSYVDVTPLLAAEGYRVVVPHLRCHGTTGFLSTRTFRNAEQSVVAPDIVALLDALKIDKAILAGYDWGARTATSSPRCGRSAARPLSP
jgi:pimeloyl-ACP methyl ester carboxylesterase